MNLLDMIPFGKLKIEGKTFSYYGVKYCHLHQLTSNKLFRNSSNILLGIERFCLN